MLNLAMRRIFKYTALDLNIDIGKSFPNCVLQQLSKNPGRFNAKSSCHNISFYLVLSTFFNSINFRLYPREVPNFFFRILYLYVQPRARRVVQYGIAILYYYFYPYK